jgi:hypothetical protein
MAALMTQAGERSERICPRPRDSVAVDPGRRKAQQVEMILGPLI